MLEDRLVVSRPTERPCPRTHAPCLFAHGCAPLFRRASTGPTSRDCETGTAGCDVGADPVQWRPCLRRMARARLLRVLPSGTGAQRLASGSFCGGDRHRQNEKERLIHPAKVKTNPARERGCSLRLNLRDVRDCLTSASEGRSSAPECPRTGSTILKMSPRIYCRSAPSNLGSSVI